MSHKLRISLLVAAALCLLVATAPAVPAAAFEVAGNPSAKVPCKKAKKQRKKSRKCPSKPQPVVETSWTVTSNIAPMPLECLEAIARGEDYC